MPHGGRATPRNRSRAEIVIKGFARGAKIFPSVGWFLLRHYPFRALHTPSRFSLPFPSGCACITASLSSWPWIVAITISLFRTLPVAPARSQQPFGPALTLRLQPFVSYFPIVPGIRVGVFKLLPTAAICSPISPAAPRIELASTFFIFASFSVWFRLLPIPGLRTTRAGKIDCSEHFV